MTQSLDANPYLLQQLGGYKPFEIGNAWNILSSDSTEQATNEVGRVLTGQEQFKCLQGKIRHKDQEYHWWNGCVTTVKKQGTLFLFGWMHPAAGALTQEELDQNAHCLPDELSEMNLTLGEDLNSH